MGSSAASSSPRSTRRTARPPGRRGWSRPRRPGRRRTRSRGRRSPVRPPPPRWHRRWPRPPRDPSTRPGRRASRRRRCSWCTAPRTRVTPGAWPSRRPTGWGRAAAPPDGAGRGGGRHARQRPWASRQAGSAACPASGLPPRVGGGPEPERLRLVVVGEHTRLQPEALEVADLPVRTVVRVGVARVEHVVVVHELHVAGAQRPSRGGTSGRRTSRRPGPSPRWRRPTAGARRRGGAPRGCTAGCSA